ncbi:squalene/phytoene synthase family protein [uncultured Draconibacterium sp.]|uniref:phytoene/squalene synthase family protein n=1 Tax=uncultured Draconibacterium sp. TaxID=1573823 RepID=UPI00325FF9A5
MRFYNKCAFNISKVVTTSYSTSFSFATNLLQKEQRDAIYSIYGFVRFADEIVDTFHEYNKSYLLDRFEADFKEAIQQGISLNPILQSFQLTVKKYHIPQAYIDAFITSMRYDLEKKEYKTKLEAEQYIYGSADVVGLMCLKVFCNGNNNTFDKLLQPAMKLGSAFQKVNFLRDLREDTENLGRSYFAELNNKDFCEEQKNRIVKDIEADFETAYKGIKELPGKSKLAVLLAYYYYRLLLNKLRKTPAATIMQSRVRIPNYKKLLIMLKAKTLYNLRLV